MKSMLNDEFSKENFGDFLLKVESWFDDFELLNIPDSDVAIYKSPAFDPAKKTILIAHGWRGNSKGMATFGFVLSDVLKKKKSNKKYNLVFMDLPYHGYSGKINDLEYNFNKNFRVHYLAFAKQGPAKKILSYFNKSATKAKKFWDKQATILENSIATNVTSIEKNLNTEVDMFICHSLSSMLFCSKKIVKDKPVIFINFPKNSSPISNIITSSTIYSWLNTIPAVRKIIAKTVMKASRLSDEIINFDIKCSINPCYDVKNSHLLAQSLLINDGYRTRRDGPKNALYIFGKNDILGAKKISSTSIRQTTIGTGHLVPLIPAWSAEIAHEIMSYMENK